MARSAGGSSRLPTSRLAPLSDVSRTAALSVATTFVVFSELRFCRPKLTVTRSPGSIASRATWRGQSGKPKKGVRMAGHMGMDQVTTRNHPLVKVDKDKNLLLIKGALPGPNGALLFIRKSITARVKAAAE